MRVFTSHSVDAHRVAAPSSPRVAPPDRRRTVVKWLKLTGLSLVGVCVVSIPVTVAIILSTTGASEVLTLGSFSPRHHHQTPAKTIAGMRCVARRGYYALTFDGGPSASTTRRLVAVLARERAVATFFDIGRRAQLYQNLVELQRSVGQVANASYSAADMTGVSQARRYQELQAAASVLDYPNVFFRPPLGATNTAVEADVRRTGLTTVYWTVDASAGSLSAAEIVQLTLRVSPGGIIRLTEGRAQTLEAVPRVVGGLRDRGMCPGLIATTERDVVGANGLTFHATAVKP